MSKVQGLALRGLGNNHECCTCCIEKAPVKCCVACLFRIRAIIASSPIMCFDFEARKNIGNILKSDLQTNPQGHQNRGRLKALIQGHFFFSFRSALLLGGGTLLFKGGPKLTSSWEKICGQACVEATAPFVEPKIPTSSSGDSRGLCSHVFGATRMHSLSCIAKETEGAVRHV